MSERVVGIDLGLKGGVAIVTDGVLTSIHKLPNLVDLKKMNVAVTTFKELLQADDLIVWELPWVGRFTNKQGRVVQMSRTAMTTYARQVGAITAIAASHTLRFAEVCPKTWQKELVGEVKDKKVGSVQRAKNRWPERESFFRGTMGSHYADACNLAWYGWLHRRELGV
jgi:hypothetical protein